MRFEWWTTNVADTHSEYVIIIALPRQQWLSERATMICYTYIACLVCWAEVGSQWFTWLNHVVRLHVVRYKVRQTGSFIVLGHMQPSALAFQWRSSWQLSQVGVHVVQRASNWHVASITRPQDPNKSSQSSVLSSLREIVSRLDNFCQLRGF